MYPPPLLQGEFLSKTALRVQPDPTRDREVKREWLHYTSRVNFSKIYTVEHNVKVMGIGTVGDEHVHLLRGYLHLAMGT